MEEIFIYTFLSVENQQQTNLQKTKQVDACVIVSNLLLDPCNMLIQIVRTNRFKINTFRFCLELTQMLITTLRY